MKTADTTEQREQCLNLWRDAFNMDQSWGDRFVKLVGWETTRLAEVDGRVGASLVAHPFGQFFGGKRLECAGIGVVASAPEYRGRGLARDLLTEMLREQHEMGVPISSLYPSTRRVYRRVGYETAMAVFTHTIALHRIDVGSVHGGVRAMNRGDHDLVKDLYRRYAEQTNGLLDRTEFVWWRKFNQHNGEPRRGYLAIVDGEPQGYILYHTTEKGDEGRIVMVWDVIALVPEAGRVLLSLLSGLRSIDKSVQLFGPSNHPLLMLLQDHPYTSRLIDQLMLRIIDVEQALSGRGYPGVDGVELHLDMSGDDVIESNNGRFVLRVGDGAGTVERGGRGDLRVSIRGLAALFSGHLSPLELARCGLLEGDAGAMNTAMATFAGPEPTIADAF